MNPLCLTIHTVITVLCFGNTKLINYVIFENQNLLIFIIIAVFVVLAKGTNDWFKRHF